MNFKRSLEENKKFYNGFYGMESLPDLDPIFKRNYEISDNDLWVILMSLYMLKMNYDSSFAMAAFGRDIEAMEYFSEKIEEIWDVYDNLKNIALGPDWKLNLD